jgi:hypothetical protein
MAMLLACTMDLFLRFGDIGFPGVLWYGLYLLVSIFSITSLMDRATYAPLAEVVRFGLVLMVMNNSQWNWFGISGDASGFSYIILGYSFLSLLLCFYFHFAENKTYRISAT